MRTAVRDCAWALTHGPAGCVQVLQRCAGCGNADAVVRGVRALRRAGCDPIPLVYTTHYIHRRKAVPFWSAGVGQVLLCPERLQERLQ